MSANGSPLIPRRHRHAARQAGASRPAPAINLRARRTPRPEIELPTRGYARANNHKEIPI